MTPKIIKIKVIPNSKVEKIIELDANNFKIKLMAPALENKANKALLEILSRHFKVAKSKITILRGETSREKTVSLSH
jgi:uncharacterized protein